MVEAYYSDAHPIADLSGRGTIVGATVVSNAVAGAGVTSGVTLIGAKVCRIDLRCSVAAVFQGIFHAVDAGADVVNMSLAGASLRVANRDHYWVQVDGEWQYLHFPSLFVQYCEVPATALLVEDYGRNPGRIKARIEASADDVGPAGLDPYAGKGRINVARALGLR